MDISHCLENLSTKLDKLPPDLRVAVEQQTHDRILALISQALIGGDKDDLVLGSLSEELLTDVCARLLSLATSTNSQLRIQAALAGIITFVPFFDENIHKVLSTTKFQTAVKNQVDGLEIIYLKSLLRLLHFDHDQFSEIVDLKLLSSLSEHVDPDVRYLAARVLSLTLGASDRATQDISSTWLTSQSCFGIQDPVSHFRFFAIEECLREQRLRGAIIASSNRLSERQNILQPCDGVVSLGDVLLPRPAIDLGATSTGEPGPVLTESTTSNLHDLGKALKQRNPILVSGHAGSGKSTLIRHAARTLGKLDTMITLHLNEQSDAKTLIGIYTTGSTPGSFVWQAGVLTKAVTEGRWILIEDLERAPNEILSVLLPLIERRELALPGRDQVLKAALGFRILATVRTSNDHKGKEYNPASTLLGLRHWTQVAFAPPASPELAQIISGTFPQIAVYTEVLVRTFTDLHSRQLYAKKSDQGRSATVRPVSPRELFAWAARISALIGSRSTIDREIEDQMLLAGLDCFAGFLPDGPSRQDYGLCIAQHIGIDPQRFQHLSSPDRNISHKIQDRSVSIGSYRFPRPPNTRSISSRSKTFSMNRHTSRHVERIAAAVASSEPLLLVGETGTGKTTSIQYLADILGKRLTPFNMSQQSESGDLLGGFKPINTRTLMIPLQDEFDYLFKSTFPTKALEKNQKFFDLLSKALAKQRWLSVCNCWDKAWGMFEEFRRSRSTSTSDATLNGEGAPSKKRRVEVPIELEARWERFRTSSKDVEARLRSGADSTVAFSFVEGGVVKAAREGDWVLLDEINLASPDTLEALADLFDKSPSITLSEAGSVQRIDAHPDFRIFAAMNPATDVGKKDLPLGIRSRFTELYVDSPESDLQSLQQIVQTYLGPSEVALSEVVSRLHQEIQGLCQSGTLVDGAGQKPHFSLRTLTRVLLFARDMAGQCSLRRALHEGFSMSYLTMLDAASEQQVMPIIDQFFYGKNKKLMNELRVSMTKPSGISESELIHMTPYWLKKGSTEPAPQAHYIKTPSVQRNLDKLIRASMTRRFPILLQGPTSSGKTSMVEYLAKESGHKFVRINNHEHTDLQEYLGSYVSGSDGRLFFQEGVLVQAIREGHWIVLDELNLAPTDVLEALNRLLDDNRELLIPDTQEIVRPHPSFMIFATQNPAGIYGGRKMLSRAFRNRFLELHFDDIPVDELQTILVARSRKAPSWCELIVKVYKELSLIRQEGKVFEQKGFATLRDLFRWALRPADTAQDLAHNGYMLLAERCRKHEEREEVRKVIEKVVGTKSYKLVIDPEKLYNNLAASPPSTSVVWTKAMKRLYSLASTAIANNEPVLLVGETGCGKTTVCQVIAEAQKKHLHIVNAHQNTETGDLIGAQRPARNRAAVENKLASLLGSLQIGEVQTALQTQSLEAALEVVNNIDSSQVNGHNEDLAAIKQAQGELKVLFEWSDGSLIEAMKNGELFLLDEISLADDSVLERLNSVLEPSRSILLAEKGTLDSFVTAASGFQFFATMNPGGDYGKKELSPALRNRFTEIWVPALSDTDDILQVIEQKLEFTHFAGPMLEFAQWFQRRYNPAAASCVHIRDLLAWSEFANTFGEDQQAIGFTHGAAMVYLDSLGANPSGMVAVDDRNVHAERNQCMRYLESLSEDISCEDLYFGNKDPDSTAGNFLASALGRMEQADFLRTSTIASNAVRVARALKLSKPILLEGAPGVGKTTLVADLAKAARIPLTRINLSEQTDLMDLFGSDVPIEGEGLATFAWKDAPFLRAMKHGEWVLLDEMNLASQSILEGLNACLDHRGKVYIPELNQTFPRHANFRLFAAQNPHHQGGGRKGLPASFVNRFTVVYADVLRRDDLIEICRHSYPTLVLQDVTTVVDVVMNANDDIQSQTHSGIGSVGSPWELNLRDCKRWLEILSEPKRLLRAADLRHVFSTVILQRFRTSNDRSTIKQGYSNKSRPVGIDEAIQSSHHVLGTESLQVGLGLLPREWSNQASVKSRKNLYNRYDIRPRFETLESVMLCVQMKWPILLVGPTGCGKTTLIEQLALTVDADLTTFSISADIDSMDLVGGYEQHDPLRLVHETGEALAQSLRQIMVRLAASDKLADNLVIAYDLAQEMSTAAVCPSAAKLDWLSQVLHVFSSGPQETAEQERLRGLLANIDQIKADGSGNVGARFEWIDGTLIRAMQKGEWLVLDNANLCSPAALDRLNSLLEPRGKLIINEHTEADGKARVVKPHHNFRIFLTMDPKHGELSRALRNRCVELFMPDCDAEVDASAVKLQDAALDRIHSIQAVLDNESTAHITPLVLEHLCPDDIRLWEAYGVIYNHGQTLYNVDDLKDGNDVHEDDRLADDSEIDGIKTIAARHPLANPYPRLSLDSHPAWRIALLFADATKFELRSATRHRDKLLIQARAQAAPGKAKARLFQSAADPEMPGAYKALYQLNEALRTHFVDDPDRKRLGDAFAFGVDPAAMIASPLPPQRYDILVGLLDSLQWLWLDLHDYAGRVGTSEAIFSLLGHQFFDALAGFHREQASTAQNMRDADDSITLPASFEASLADVINNFGAPVSQSIIESSALLWEICRPFTLATQESWSDLLNLRCLIKKFDSTVGLKTMSLQQATKLRTLMTKNFALLMTSQRMASAPLETVKQIIDETQDANASDAESVMVQPHLKEAFESLNRHMDLVKAENHDFTEAEEQDLVQAAYVLAERTIESALHVYQPSDTQQGPVAMALLLHQLNNYIGDSAASLHNLSCQLSTSLRTADSVPIRQIPLLQAELSTMGKLLASNTHVLAQEHTRHLHAILPDLLRGVLLQLKGDTQHFEASPLAEQVLHSLVTRLPYTPPASEPQTTQAGDRLAISDAGKVIVNAFGEGCVAFLLKYESGEASHEYNMALAQAWISFACGCIALYLPSTPQDPALRYILAHQLHNRHMRSVEDEIEALRLFENAYIGNAPYTSVRMRRLAIKRGYLGSSQPPEPKVCRLDDNTIDALLTLLRSAHELFLPYTSCLFELPAAPFPAIEHDVQLRRNITVLKNRLKSSYHELEDLTAPLVGFLSCLEIGLDLYAAAIASAEQRENSADLTRCVPLAGSPDQPRNLIELPENWLRFVRKGAPSISILQALLASKTLGPETFAQDKALECVAQLLSYVHMQWKKDLLREQTENAAKSSLYKYTGGDSVEDEVSEAEFSEMFPDYEAPVSEAADATSGYQSQASRFASTLISFFDTTTDNQAVLLSLLDSISTASDASAAAIISPDTRLHLAIRQLDRQSAVLKKLGSHDPKSYNIYADPNIGQVLLMVELIDKVKSRFHTIQKAWPEHATLADVLQTCEELLDFAHTEPLMKIITKVEKLHDQVHEWQTVASKEFSAEAMYTSITDLIVSWRQLELSAWSRMLDQEVGKCKDDAQAWFFVAFESIVAGTHQFRETTEGLHAYVLELLKTLDTFFRSTGLGQYSARLRIVEALQEMVDQADYLPDESKNLICGSLHNFLAFFKRFEKSVEDAVLSGRKKLDADMKNVIQLASWKDRNILSLKQSAKTSHRKLFKVIRKFRALLGQPVDSIIAAGVPNMAISPPRAALVVPAIKSAESSQVQALGESGVQELAIPSWEQLPARFKNVDKTVSLIGRLSRVPVEKPDSSAEISLWLSDTQATAEMLRKATPTLMTVEHKAIAQHLKSRKRGLFADVLKSLRIMGFKSNLGTDTLTQQDSMVAVLTSAAQYTGSAASQAEYQLHQLLHWMPQVRESGRQHSEDLTGAEVSRSSALIESMLQNIVAQKVDIATHTENTMALEELLQNMYSLATLTDVEVPEATINHAAISDSIVSLTTVLDTAQELMVAHFRMAISDGANYLQALPKLSEELKASRASFKAIPALPANLMCQEQRDILKTILQQVSEVRTSIEQITDDVEPLTPLLSQVLQWTQHEHWVTKNAAPPSSISLDTFQTQVCNAVDQLLASIETVPKTLADLPESFESPGWATREAQVLNAALIRLRLPEAIDKLSSILDSISRVPSSDLPVATAFLTSLAPIFTQYHAAHSNLTSRFLALHISTAGMAASLARLYVTLAKDGFCSPKEKDTETSQDKDGVEAGTGLGDGEGAEDISKDIGDDEDLGELAQEKNEERNKDEELEDEKDAVDMADQDLEGEYGEERGEDKEEEGEEGDEGEDREVESEAGSVDDLGEGTVDEKMWDDGGKEEEDQKEQEADEAEGTKSEDLAAAGEEKKKKEKEKGGEEVEEGEEGEEEEIGAEEEENEEGQSKEAERADPTMQQEENLELPDDIDIDGPEKNDEVEDDMDMMDEDGKDMEEEGGDVDEQHNTDDEGGDVEPEQSENKELDDGETEEKTNEAGEDAEEDVDMSEDDENVLQDNRPDDATVADQVAPSDAQGTGLDEEQPDDKEDQQAPAGQAQRPQGAQGEDAEMQESSGAQGSRNEADEQEAGAEDGQEEQMTAAEESYKRLGDAMEKWYKQQQRQIQDPSKREESAERKRNEDADMEDAEFEHLSDEEDEGDTQALGAARQDEATAIDENAGTAVNEQDRTDQFQPEDNESADKDDPDTEMREADANEQEQQEIDAQIAKEQAKAFIGEYREPPAQDQRGRSMSPTPQEPPEAPVEEDDVPSDVEDHQHAADAADHNQSDPHQTWNEHLSRTLAPSLQLQEQLRLILHPTSSTKLRGDFRTGKRLNIKRIIPYIASNYKRDKIWLRRSVPSKREYQIVLAIDDSGSMGNESGGGRMALDTVAMVSRALGMLEAGELSVVGFGRTVDVPVRFGEALSVEKGAEVVRRIRFGQAGTDVKALLERTGRMFAEARGKAGASSRAGLQTWQLMLVVGDGVFDDEEGVRRMERALRDEGVMVVFVIVDADAQSKDGPAAAARQSIVDLKRPKFWKDADGNTKVDIARYIETFPFRYYLIVREVAELPNVLASALRQWFAEIAETG